MGLMLLGSILPPTSDAGSKSLTERYPPRRLIFLLGLDHVLQHQPDHGVCAHHRAVRLELAARPRSAAVPGGRAADGLGALLHHRGAAVVRGLAAGAVALRHDLLVDRARRAALAGP